MSKIVKIYLIRHARQNSPLCNVDVPLADEGLIQSMLVGQRLRAYDIAQVYSSNLIRAIMTANVIRCEINRKENRKNGLLDIDNMDCKAILDEISQMQNSACEFEELRETDFGELTGLEDSVLRVRYRDYYEARDLKREDLRIPGGENGEEVFIRMQRAMQCILEDAIRKDYANIAVVSHGGAIRCYLAGLLGMPQSHRFMLAKNMENTSITEIFYDVDKQIFSVERMNDYSHLEGYDKLLRKHFKEPGKA